MITLIVLLGISCGTSLLMTPLLRFMAAQCGLIDRPDGRRKIHARPIPLAGGLAVFVSATIALLIVLLSPNPLRQQLADDRFSLLGLFLAAVIICIVGVVDDFGYLRGRHKLLGQLLAIAVVMCFGLVVDSITIFNQNFELGLLAIPFTAFWLLGAINSLNLIDGMDGLLGTVGSIICLGVAAMAVAGDHWVAACLAVAMAGALLGFLRYNFPPATIFLGDAGSMLIGLVIGVLAIHSSMKTHATLALTAPLAVLTIPIFDATAAILRRKLTGRSIYTTDRGHLHHVLLRRGFSSRRVLLCVSFFCLIAVSGALASLYLKNELWAFSGAALVVSVLITTRLFGYAEFQLVKQRIMATAVSFLVPRKEGNATQMEIHLQGTADWKGLWNTLTSCADQLNLRMIRLDVNAPAMHEGYHARWDRFHEETEVGSVCWRAEFPLEINGQPVARVEIMGVRDEESMARKISQVAQLVETFESAVVTWTEGLNGNGHVHSAVKPAKVVQVPSGAS